MAKARPVEIKSDEPFADAARRVLAVRAAEVLEHVPAVRAGEDPEAVHDLRVAARRLRAVLEVFADAFPRKRHAALLDEVKRVGDAFGGARDLDVQIELCERFVSQAWDEERTGVAALTQRLHADREAELSSAFPALDRLERAVSDGVRELCAR
jgi:CHAD domain-containing protein